jgi:hypothetical protein
VVVDDGSRDGSAKIAARIADPRAGVAYGDRVLVDRHGRLIGSERGALLAARPSGDVLGALLARNFLSTPGQACIRVDALGDAAQWDVGLRRMSDWYPWCRIASHTAFGYIGRGPVVEYRIHKRSMSRSFTSDSVLPPGIEELRPAIDAVFALPEVARRFPAERFARLRTRSEASAYAWKAQDLLRAGRFAESRRYLLEALRRHPTQPVDLLCLVLASLGFVPPGVRRFVGRT